jgi:hypothetical protein
MWMAFCYASAGACVLDSATRYRTILQAHIIPFCTAARVCTTREGVVIWDVSGFQLGARGEGNIGCGDGW